MFTVNVPIANLRSEPSELDFVERIDRRQESQLLFGEAVERLEQKEGWVKVRAIEQDRFRPETEWTGYPGWIKEKQLSAGRLEPHLVVTALWSNTGKFPIPLGSYLEKAGETQTDWIVKNPAGDCLRIPKKDAQGLPPKEKSDRKAIIDTAQLMLGHKYAWGGRCPFNPDFKDTFTSVDCSGLANLAYRVQGLSIPRDAHDQFLKSDPIQPDCLKTADLIFLAPADRAHRMSHVMLYMEGDRFIDANIADGKVVISTARERFGVPFAEMATRMQVRQEGVEEGKMKVKQYIIHFGRPLCLKA